MAGERREKFRGKHNRNCEKKSKEGREGEKTKEWKREVKRAG